MYDNTRDCAKCGLLAAGGSADIPHPTSPLSGLDSTPPRVILQREVGEIFANMGRDPGTQTALLSSYRTDGRVKQGRTLL